MVPDRLGCGTGNAAERDCRRGCAGGLEGATFRSARGPGSICRRPGRVRCRFKRRHFRGRACASRPRGRPPHRAALRPHRSGSLSAPPPHVLRIFLIGVGTPLTGRPRNRRSRHPGVGMALRLRGRPALRHDRSTSHRLRPALGPDCTGAAFPRSRSVVSRRRTRRYRRHAAPARGCTILALRSVRRLRPRRVHRGVGAPPPPPARNLLLPPRHALGDSGEAERDGLTGRSRRHDSAHSAAGARVVRGILRLVGHPRFDHMGHRCGRPGTRSRSASATPTPGHRRRTHGDRRDPRRSDPSPLDSRVGGPHRLAPGRPRSRPRPRSPLRHGTRGHARIQARARRLVAAGRRLGWTRA